MVQYFIYLGLRIHGAPIISLLEQETKAAISSSFAGLSYRPAQCLSFYTDVNPSMNWPSLRKHSDVFITHKKTVAWSFPLIIK